MKPPDRRTGEDETVRDETVRDGAVGDAGAGGHGPDAGEVGASERRTPSIHDVTMQLLQLARESADERARAPDPEGLNRLELALAKRVAPRRRTTIVRWALIAAALTLAGAVGGVLTFGERALTFDVKNGTVSDGGYISAGVREASVAFSDESQLGLEPETRLRVSRIDVHGAGLMLEGGTMHVRIHPRPKASWTIDAGPYVVRVTGTEFDLAWRVEEQTLDLHLFKGSVTVQGPLADAGLKMVAGQHLVANSNDGALSIVDDRSGKNEADVAPSDAGGSASAAPAGPNVPSSSGDTAPAGSAGRPVASVASVASTANAGSSDRTTDGKSWATRVAHGDFDGVIAGAEHKGVDRAIAEASPVDLAALSDAARYSRRDDIAFRALTAERSRFPASVQARDASFFLGGLAEGKKNDAGASDWYDVYLRESPNGAYASQALGRKMLLVQRASGTDAARSIAVDYLRRFPDGPYATAARKLTPSP